MRKNHKNSLSFLYDLRNFLISLRLTDSLYDYFKIYGFSLRILKGFFKIFHAKYYFGVPNGEDEVDGCESGSVELERI